MNPESYKIFEINTDAIAVNRGFYYQYLLTLNKWVENYISGSEKEVWIEIDDDIVEVGDEMIFTQVKSYSSSFSLNSKEIKKTIFNFFMLFLKYQNEASPKFCFTTNTKLKKSEKLLKAWIGDSDLVDESIRNIVIPKVQEIISKNLKQKRDNKLQKKGKYLKEEIDQAYNSLRDKINSDKVSDFVKSIRWVFLEEDPETAIGNLYKETNELLRDSKFNSKPADLIEKVLLSEIYQYAQLKDKQKRVLTNKLLQNILDSTESEILKYVNHKFIRLIDLKYEQVEKHLKSNTGLLKNHESRIVDLEKDTKQKNKKYPKELSIIPNYSLGEIYGRSNSFIEVYELLKEKRAISILGSLGSGKTFFIKKMLSKYIENYNHIIWINAEQSLKKAFVFDPVILNNLQINPPKNSSVNEQYKIVCNEINKIPGNNLIIVDNFENDFEDIEILISINWQIIISTNNALNIVYQYKLPVLDFESAKKVFHNSISKDYPNEEGFLPDLIKFIDFNPLLIELCAKTISNSLDINAESLLNHFRNQTLDEENIEISISNYDSSIALLPYLLKRFKYKNLSDKEENVLNFLALLPSENIFIDDLALIGGKNFHKTNKTHFLNTLNSLSKKGWVKRENEVVGISKIIQEVIKYHERKSQNSFASNMFLFVWLFRRIDEVALTNPIKSFRFLKYAESILNSIKETDRASVYQPLLLLENALLNAYNWLEASDDLHNRWLNLLERSQNYLSNEDANLGVIFNNVGHSFLKQNNYDKALIYFEEAQKILAKYLPETVDTLLISFINTLNVYFIKNEIANAKKVIKKTLLLIKNHSVLNTWLIGSLYHTVALGFQKYADLSRAEPFYKKAIKHYISISSLKRNDFYLVLSLYNYSGLLFKMKKYDVARENLEKALVVLEQTDFIESVVFVKITESIKLLNDYIEEISR